MSEPTAPFADRDLRRIIQQVVESTPVIDLHTHLFPPRFGALSLWGIDELVTYHYLIAEVFRFTPLSPEHFWAMSKAEQADLIWEHLFVRNTPLSEATRGVVAVLTAFGLDPAARDLREARAFFASADVEQHFHRVLDMANVSAAVMTNDPFHTDEARVWCAGGGGNGRFHAALRLDPLLNQWETTPARLSAQGYGVSAAIDGQTAREARRFLDEWIARMQPLYMAVSLPSDFAYPEQSARAELLRQVIFPTAREHGVPFAMMIGVRRAVNPALRDAGDGVGKADLGAVEAICRENPDCRFLVTVLSRENQHELVVAARKFSNLLPFGCWWFLNNPSIVAEITAERLEMLGSSFVPQHSDARILEQVIYKWRHARRVVAEALFASCRDLAADGWPLTREHIERDVRRLFSENFSNWVGLDRPAVVPAE